MKSPAGRRLIAATLHWTASKKLLEEQEHFFDGLVWKFDNRSVAGRLAACKGVECHDDCLSDQCDAGNHGQCVEARASMASAKIIDISQLGAPADFMTRAA